MRSTFPTPLIIKLINTVSLNYINQKRIRIPKILNMRCKNLLLYFIFLCYAFFSQAQVTLITDPVTLTSDDKSFCQNVRVADFEDIVNMQFSMSWDVNVLQLDSVININLPFPANFFTNLSLAPTGAVPIIWFDPWGGGATVPDGTVIFQMCFTIVGDIGDCSAVSFVDLPLNMEVSDVASGGQNIGVNAINGEACIVEPYSFPNTTLQHVNCAALSSGAININPNGGVPPYSFQWSGPNGFMSSQEDLSGLDDGIYTLIISDSSNPPLTDTLSFMVEGDFVEPTANAGTADTLNCVDTTVQLNGIASSMGLTFTYQWITTNGNIVSGGTTLSPTVNGAGDYLLVVTNEANGCTAESSVTVAIDTIPPAAMASASNNIDCINSSSDLSGAGSSTGNAFEYAWTTVDGLILSGTTSLNAEAGGAGEYVLEVRNTDNSCINTAAVAITLDTIPPIVEAGSSEQIDCSDPMLSLDGTASSTGLNFNTQWTTSDGHIVSGANSLQPVVDEAGTYYLTIINEENGCVARDSVFIAKDDKVPAVVVSQDTMLSCYAPVLTLSGAGSAEGAGIIYTWSTSDGNIVGANSGLTIMVDEPGTYSLVVQDTTNGCGDDAFVMVADSFPPEAIAGIDQELCTDETNLQGVLPPGLTGSWSAVDPMVFVEQPNQASSVVADLQAGTNLLIWSLSTPLCPDYDQDTVLLFVEGTPHVVDDQYSVTLLASNFPMEVTANDQLNSLSGWSANLLTNSSAGIVSVQGGGIFNYTNTNQFTGTTTFEYTICSEACSNRCDTASVLITVTENLDTNTTVSNGITPNDDGTNDFFIIPELEISPEDFPNNELIIFNRWGDIVYKAAPYQNDFKGVRKDGQTLPQGTYYYIMRLKLSEGKVYRGDLTIVR